MPLLLKYSHCCQASFSISCTQFLISRRLMTFPASLSPRHQLHNKHAVTFLSKGPYLQLHQYVATLIKQADAAYRRKFPEDVPIEVASIGMGRKS